MSGRRRSKANGPKCLYFIATDESLYVKIGLSCDVMARLSELQGANAEDLSLLLWLPLTDHDPAVIEGELHEALSAYRMNGEWFRPNPWLNQVMLKLKAGQSPDAVIAWVKAELVKEAA